MARPEVKFVLWIKCQKYLLTIQLKKCPWHPQVFSDVRWHLLVPAAELLLKTFRLYWNVQHLVLALTVNKSLRGSQRKGTHTGCVGQLPNCRMLWENLSGYQKKGTAFCSRGSLGRLACSFSIINTLTFLQKGPKNSWSKPFCECKHVSLFMVSPIHCFSQIYCSCVRWNGERKGVSELRTLYVIWEITH